MMTLVKKSDGTANPCPKCGGYCYEPGDGTIECRNTVTCGWSVNLISKPLHSTPPTKLSTNIMSPEQIIKRLESMCEECTDVGTIAEIEELITDIKLLNGIE